MIIPPLDGVPKKLRGLTFKVTFFVAVTGQVTDLEITPAIEDRKYARRFEEAMRDYDFRAARDADGKLVPGIFVTEVTLQGN